MITQKDYDLVKERLELVEGKFADLLVKLDLDAGVTDTDYQSVLEPRTTKLFDITNASNKALRFSDMTGKEFLLSPSEVVSIKGMTETLIQWEIDGLITKVPTP